MSFRTDSGVCKYCGSVMELAQLTRLEGGAGDQGEAAVDDYVCPDCGDEGQPGSSPGVA